MEALCHVMRMHDEDNKLLNGIKSMYVNSLACVRVNGRGVNVSGSIVV